MFCRLASEASAAWAPQKQSIDACRPLKPIAKQPDCFGKSNPNLLQFVAGWHPTVGDVSSNTGVAPRKSPCDEAAEQSCNAGSCSSRSAASCSRNPFGRPSKSDMLRAGSTSAARSVLAFECPKRGNRRCCGLYMSFVEQEQRPAQADARAAAVLALRERLQQEAKESGLISAILAEMLQLTRDCTGKPAAEEFPWALGGQPVCKWCFAAAANMLSRPLDNQCGPMRVKDTMARAMQEYKKPVAEEVQVVLAGLGHAPAKSADVARSKAANSTKEPRSKRKEEHAALWLGAFSHDEAGNVQHRTDDEKDHVQGCCRQGLFDKYKEQHPSMASRSAFYRAVQSAKKDKLCDLSFHQWSAQAECACCTALKICKSRSQSDAEKVYWQAELDLHNFIARAERLCYGSNISLSQLSPFGLVLWSFALDGYSTFKSSGPSLYAKPLCDMKGATGLSGAEQLKFKTTGVIVHGYGYLLYVLEPHLPSNANSNIFTLHSSIMHMFSRLADPNDKDVQIWPRFITVQVDGASDNKCRAMFAYLEWLVLNGTFDRIEISFLLVGHTHADYDQKFVQLTRALRRTAVKQMEDLLATYKAAYGEDPELVPKLVQAVRAGPDFTQWLVIGGNVEVKGMARRVPDVDRPHRFEITATASGVAGSRGADTNYKNLAANDEHMNVVDGTLQPVQWLEEMPDAAGPAMQPVQEHLRDALMVQKPNVYRNFAFNECAMGRGMFEDSDIAWYDTFYSMICSAPALTQAMAMAFKWHAPGQRGAQPNPVVAVRSNVSKVPPIVHRNFTKADRDRMIREEKAANASEESRVDALLAEHNMQKDPTRGFRVQSKASKDLVARKTRAAIVAGVCGSAGAGSAKSGASPADSRVQHDVSIVGAAQPDSGKLNEKYGIVYLVRWSDCVGQEDEYAWLNASDLEYCYDSLDDELDGEVVNGESSRWC